jgi:hypothetical protein
VEVLNTQTAMRVTFLAIMPALRRPHATITLRAGLSGEFRRMSNRAARSQSQKY